MASALLVDRLRKAVDMTGKRCGSWTVISRSSPIGDRNTYWTCECVCGNICEIMGGRLRDGRSRQCARCRHEAQRQSGISAYYWSKLKYSARKRGYEVSIDRNYLDELFQEQESKCALSGWYIDLPRTEEQARKANFTASVDRVDSNLGYVKGNVQWVHKDVNKAKWDFDQDYFITICKSVTDINKD